MNTTQHKLRFTPAGPGRPPELAAWNDTAGEPAPARVAGGPNDHCFDAARQRSIAMAVLLATAAILLDCVVATRLDATVSVSLALFCGLAFGQLTLLAAWLAWGGSTWLPPLAANLAMAAVLAGPLSWATAGRWQEWFGVLGLFSAGVTALLLIWRYQTRLRSGPNQPGWTDAERAPRSVADQHRAYHVVPMTGAQTSWRGGAEEVAERRESRRMEEGPWYGRGDNPPAPVATWQFSLGGLLSFMTVCAVALGMRNHIVFPWHHALALAGYGTCLALVACVALWASLHRSHISRRLAVLGSTCLVTGIMMHYVEHAQSVGHFMFIVLVEAATIGLGVYVTDPGGWRARVTGERS